MTEYFPFQQLALGLFIEIILFPSFEIAVVRQQVAARIEASGTPLGLPDVAFDAPSMVQVGHKVFLHLVLDTSC